MEALGSETANALSQIQEVAIQVSTLKSEWQAAEALAFEKAHALSQVQEAADQCAWGRSGWQESAGELSKFWTLHPLSSRLNVHIVGIEVLAQILGMTIFDLRGTVQILDTASLGPLDQPAG